MLTCRRWRTIEHSSMCNDSGRVHTKTLRSCEARVQDEPAAISSTACGISDEVILSRCAGNRETLPTERSKDRHTGTGRRVMVIKLQLQHAIKLCLMLFLSRCHVGTHIHKDKQQSDSSRFSYPSAYRRRIQSRQVLRLLHLIIVSIALLPSSLLAVVLSTTLALAGATTSVVVLADVGVVAAKVRRSGS